jgi:hypothetical protein
MVAVYGLLPFTRQCLPTSKERPIATCLCSVDDLLIIIDYRPVCYGEKGCFDGPGYLLLGF